MDYAALNLKLQEEQKRPRGDADGVRGPLSDATPPAAPLTTSSISQQPVSAVTDSAIPAKGVRG